MDRLVSSLPEADRIPRKDGDLAFDAPWQIRALGLAVAAHRTGHYEWAEFQGELVAAIREWEEAPEDQRSEWAYYERWLRALERLVVERGLVDPAEYTEKTQELLTGQRHRTTTEPLDHQRPARPPP